MLAGRRKGRTLRRGSARGVIVDLARGSSRRLEPVVDSIEAQGQKEESDSHQEEYDRPTLHGNWLSWMLFIFWLDIIGTMSDVNGIVGWDRRRVVILGGSRKACHACFVECNSSCSEPFISLEEKVCENMEE